MLNTIKITFKPVDVEFECPHCGFEHFEKFETFSLSGTQINEWKVVHCCNCHKDFEIDDVEINADSLFEALTEGRVYNEKHS